MFGTEGLSNLLCKHASTSSVWNFYHWVKEVPLSKTSLATRSKEKRPFSQANSLPTNFIYPATWNLSESPATCKQLSGLCQKTLPEPNLCLKFCRQPMRVLLYEGSQTNLTSNLQSFLRPWCPSYVSHSSIVGSTSEPLKICSIPVQDKCLSFSSAWKRKKKFKTEQSYKNWKFHIGEISGPCLALTHSPGLFLHKMGFEIMFDDYLVRKKACLDYKNIDFRGLPHWIFSWFWSKIRTFLFVMRYQFGGVVQIKINLILWNPYTVGLLELYITSRATCPLRM